MSADDRKLLELAAKAAGIAILRPRLDNPICADMLLVERTDDGHAIGWNPLTNDGDALRLAVKLNMMVDVEGTPFHKTEIVIDHKIDNICEPHDSDVIAATRRAIVRAAAAIGEMMS